MYKIELGYVSSSEGKMHHKIFSIPRYFCKKKKFLTDSVDKK